MSEGHTPRPASLISLKEIEQILTRELSIKSDDEYAELHGITDAAQAIAERILQVWSAYNNAAPDLLAALKAMTEIAEGQGAKWREKLPDGNSPLGLARTAIAKAGSRP